MEPVLIFYSLKKVLSDTNNWLSFSLSSSCRLSTSRFSESRDKVVYLCRALAMARKKEYPETFRVLDQRTHESFSTHFFRKDMMPPITFILHLTRYKKFSSSSSLSLKTLFPLRSYNMKKPMSIPLPS